MDGKGLNPTPPRLRGASKILASYWLFLVLGLTFFLRLPSLFEPFTYGDEGIYLTLGQALRKGLVFYRDIHDNKPPFLYLLAALANSFSYYRLILFIWSFATIFMFFKLASLLFPKRKLAVIAPTIFFAILTSLHTFEGNVANAENFMMLPTIIGFYLFFKKDSQKVPWFLIGVLFSFATLFKIPAAFDFAALLVLFILMSKTINRALVAKCFLLVVGFLTPILATFVYYATKGALPQYLTAAFFQNIPYLSSWGMDKPQTVGLPLPLICRGVLLLAIVAFLFVRRDKISTGTKLIILWFSFALFAALLSGRPYPHYLLQAIPALTLSFGLFFHKDKQKIVPLILSVGLIAAFLLFKFWHYPNISYYQNFYQFLLGTKTKDEYFANFGGHTQALYQTAEFLETRSQSHEKIFVWGTQPSLYALVRRLPVGRYTTSYHIIDFNGYQETMEALIQNLPRYIIVDQEEKQSFPAFKSFVQDNYILELQTSNFQIFHRILRQL